MRLWHSKLIPLLDGRRLCDLHMSCCNLRGKGWGKRNAAVGYLYEDPLGEDALYVYHLHVIYEMQNRDFKVDEHWLFPEYCGKKRDTRPRDIVKLEEAARRNIPLQGHTSVIYLNDVSVLKERGLDIKLSCSTEIIDGTSFKIMRASYGGVETTYKIKI